MNYYASFLFYCEKNNKCLMVKNNNNKLYKAVPHNFYGFPSLTLEIDNENCSSINNEVSLNNHSFINQLPIEILEKMFNNKRSFKKESIYYLGSLVTPYYYQQAKRNYFNYFLVLVNDCNSINKTRLEHALSESISPNDPAYAGGSKEKTLEISLDWKEPKEFLNDFHNNSRFITPETLYLLQMLSYFEKDRFDPLVNEEDEDNLGIQVKMEYAPFIESIPVRSSTLFPFNTTNLILSQNEGHVLLVDPGANKDGTAHMVNIIEKRLKNHLDNNGKNLSIFITHNHFDHWEGIHLLEEKFPEATVYAHHKTLANVRTKLKKVSVVGLPLTNKESVDQIINDVSPESLGDKLYTQEKLIIGNGNRIFHVISSPGHTDDSLCLYDKHSKTLIAGDHIVGFGSSVLDFHTGDMRQYLHTTQGLIDFLEPNIAIPAHGPTSYDPIVLLNNYIKHRLIREEEILNAYKSGKCSLTEILDVVYGNIDSSLKLMTMGNIKLHLDKLKQDGKIN
ncbi:hypothetical protein DICPUDRAFT_87074 [Dictyostelium purpureum]|uniref:Metallo-beta-lactamase domain-containing protein n=1 Tax=Dictyostelium purpureum TaxID=5786 RepID=F0ZFS4_DICPU|nr:uncharacterized protein DICPUDRAFT_87074 [Dictyostelium purpureum]EGC37224.1 hypothetical protein DICPUDRAFT_87074 [Dictyostelium purpureum]|eukprot:XP_003286275.1 hypothetical protein DICPUDRAFT_87074 [Dictyostelium purpureum]